MNNFFGELRESPKLYVKKKKKKKRNKREIKLVMLHEFTNLLNSAHLQPWKRQKPPRGMVYTSRWYSVLLPRGFQLRFGKSSVFRGERSWRVLQSILLMQNDYHFKICSSKNISINKTSLSVVIKIYRIELSTLWI